MQAPAGQTPFWRQFAAFFWNPRPASWAAMAAVWALALLLHAQSSDIKGGPQLAVAAGAQTAKKAGVSFNEQKRMLAKLLETPEPEKAANPDRKKPIGPQSFGRTTWICA